MTYVRWQDLRDLAVQEAIEQKRPKLKGLTPNQDVYLDAMERARTTICVGPAGTGKSFMACGKACEMLAANRVERIVISRPLLQCDEEMGFMPGGLWEKVEDDLRPLLDAIEKFVGAGELAAMRRDGRLIAAPLAKLRGASLENAFIILDEAQNATFRQLRMFLTRLAAGSKMVVCGDYTQSDLPKGDSALYEVVQRLLPRCHSHVRIVRLGHDDVVRDELVRWFDERLTGAPPREDDEEEWFSLRCPECNATNWVDDSAEQLECHRCTTAVDLWNDEDELAPTRASSRREGCVWGLMRKP